MKIQSAEEHTIHFVTTDNPYEVTYIRISSVSWLQGTTAGYTAVHSPHQLEEEFQKHIASTYQPHVWSVRKDTIYAAITALDLGLKYARERLESHDFDLGRTTQGDVIYAETMEAHIRQMEDALKALRSEGTERSTPKPEEPKKPLSDIIMEGWILENVKKNRQMHHIHESIEERSELDTDSILTGKNPAEPTPATDTQHPSVGDYVLATKYTDGDPMDPWFIGFYSGPTTHTPPKYTITDVKGTPFCPYSFRKIKKITQKQGEWMLKNRELIQHSGMPVWHFTQLPEESLQ